MPIDETMLRTLEGQRRDAPDRARAFFRALRPDLVTPSIAELDETLVGARVRDRVYRIFHRSWKMYSLAGVTAVLVEKMLAPVEGCSGGATRAPEDLVAGMKRWGFDELFVDLVTRTMMTRFTEGAAEGWAEDAERLVAGFTIAREAAAASLEAMARMTRGEGFLFRPSPYDTTDALFLEVWASLGLALRYARDDGLVEECRGLLVIRR